MKWMITLAMLILNLNGANMDKENIKEIYLAGGCFWGVEGYFERVDGVKDVDVGYANGKSDQASYNGLIFSGHAESVRVVFDENQIPLEDILAHFFRIIDPFSINKQGNDVGAQYRSGIFYKDSAMASRIRSYVAKEQSKYTKRFAIIIEPLHHYILAESYHQDYLAKNPNGYCHIDLNKAKEPLR